MLPKRPIKRIACVGEVMIELIAKPDGTAQIGVAGDTYNTAVYLARALRGSDVSVSYVTALGTDPYSARIEAQIAHHGINTDVIEHRTGAMPGLYAIDTDDAGERSFSYWRSASAARTLFAQPCDFPVSALDQFDLVFLSGISLAILPVERRADILDWAQRFSQAGGTVAYDSNHRPALWEAIGVARQINAQMWRLADVGLPSVDDEMLLHEDPDASAVLARFQDYGVPRGVLKQGAAGPQGLAGGPHVTGLPGPERVVDSTAAGDSFNAGYLAAIALGEDDETAMRAGHHLAVKVISHPGAIIPEEA